MSNPTGGRKRRAKISLLPEAAQAQVLSRRKSETRDATLAQWLGSLKVETSRDQ
jgi:hypothetical protein